MFSTRVVGVLPDNRSPRARHVKSPAGRIQGYGPNRVASFLGAELRDGHLTVPTGTPRRAIAMSVRGAAMATWRPGETASEAASGFGGRSALRRRRDSISPSNELSAEISLDLGIADPTLRT